MTQQKRSGKKFPEENILDFYFVLWYDSFMPKILPLFKSHYSIGKSILRNDLKSYETHPDLNIFNLAKTHNLNEVTIVEDSMTGFLESLKTSEQLNINLQFGLKIFLNIDSDNSCLGSKYIIFSKNQQGCKLLNKISSESSFKEKFSLENLKQLWSNDDLIMGIPFYDSFLFQNLMFFDSCIPDFSFCDPVFFTEDNGLPFDHIIFDSINVYCEKYGYEIYPTKSIYYNKKSDFKAYQTYKCICNRSSNYKSISLESPNLDHCSSNEFCFESYLENESA